MKPMKKFMSGAIAATVWNNKTKDESAEFNTVSIDRNYKDDNGEWKSTNTLRVSDLPRAVLVLNKAYEFLSLKEEV